MSRSIACGAKFIFNSANYTLSSLATYPFPLFFEEWGLQWAEVTDFWDNKGDIVIGNEVWIGYEAVIMAGVTIGDGAVFMNGSNKYIWTKSSLSEMSGSEDFSSEKGEYENNETGK